MGVSLCGRSVSSRTQAERQQSARSPYSDPFPICPFSSDVGATCICSRQYRHGCTKTSNRVSIAQPVGRSAISRIRDGRSFFKPIDEVGIPLPPRRLVGTERLLTVLPIIPAS